MAIVSALVFAGALALIVTVAAGTLMPAWPRMVEALTGRPAPARRLAPARRHRIVRGDRRTARLAGRRREAA